MVGKPWRGNAEENPEFEREGLVTEFIPDDPRGSKQEAAPTDAG
jgi:hypothetical protein